MVGVDGSEQSRRALRWALRYAGQADAIVEAVLAWQPPFSGQGGTVPAAEQAKLGELAVQALAENVAKVAGERPAVEIRRRAEEGTAAQVLLRAAADEDVSLLVVGHRGAGGFTGALLGSVGQHCVQHAACPVVVVRGDRGTITDPTAGRADTFQSTPEDTVMSTTANAASSAISNTAENAPEQHAGVAPPAPGAPAPQVWPSLRANDARGLIRFLAEAFGFEEVVVYGEGDFVEHAQLAWPLGGGLMLGSARQNPGGAWQPQPGSFACYVVTDRPDALHQRAKAAGAEIVSPPHTTDYGSRDFSARDPEGNHWYFGTYRGEPRSPKE